MTPKEKNTLEWIGIGIACCVAAPVGIVLAAAKGISMLQERERRQNRTQWNGQSYSHNSQQQTNSTPYMNGGQYVPNAWSTRTQQYAGVNTGLNRNAAYNQAYRRMVMMNRAASPHSGIGLIVGGSIVSGIFGLCSLKNLFEGLTNLFAYGSDFEFLTTLAVLAAFTVSGGVMIHFGSKKRDKARRYRRYVTLIGDKNLANLHEIARTSGTEYNQLCEDITDLLMKGVFGNSAYIDYHSGYLILNPVGAAALKDAMRRQAEAKRSAEEARRRASEPKDPADEILDEIRKINDEISDKHLSEQIDRIEEITRLILQCQKEHPEKEAQLHSFLSYYLPTTLKILRAYADMEKQSVQGKNITETKARIEGMMDKVVHGFEVQLDQLFASDYLDISSDITVLETMMEQDGLTPGFPGTFPQGQTSAT